MYLLLSFGIGTSQVPIGSFVILEESVGSRILTEYIPGKADDICVTSFFYCASHICLGQYELCLSTPEYCTVVLLRPYAQPESNIIKFIICKAKL